MFRVKERARTQHGRDVAVLWTKPTVEDHRAQLTTPFSRDTTPHGQTLTGSSESIQQSRSLGTVGGTAWKSSSHRSVGGSKRRFPLQLDGSAAVQDGDGDQAQTLDT